MAYDTRSIMRGIVLGAISGLKTTYGPALLATSRRSKGWEALALAAMAEMVVDKLPGVPSRSRPSLMLPRALAGFWAAKSSIEEPGEARYDSQALGVALAGAAAAMGVAYFTPSIREMLRVKLGVPDAVIGFAEDALALAAGSSVVGMPASDLYHAGEAALTEARHGRVWPAVRQLRSRVVPI